MISDYIKILQNETLALSYFFGTEIITLLLFLNFNGVASSNGC